MYPNQKPNVSDLAVGLGLEQDRLFCKKILMHNCLRKHYFLLLLKDY